MNLDWLSLFPALVNLEPNARELLSKSTRVLEAPVGTIAFYEGMPCNGFTLRLKGQSRVYKLSSSGREIVLYRVHAGESCVLTTTCLLGKSDYPASTIVEDAVQDVLIPSATFHQLMLESSVFRTFVMEKYGALISDLIVLLDEVAFYGLDARLAKLLVDADSDDIKRTHQQIANELGTAREVVSRQLKTFEQNGLIELNRGSIKIKNRKALQRSIL